MSLTAIGSSSNASIQEMLKQRREAQKALEADVQSGNVSAAQQSLSALTQASTGASGGSSGFQAAGNPYKSLMSSDLAGVLTAVQAGDITTAQTALSKLKTDRQSATSGAQAVSFNDGGQTESPFVSALNNLLTSALSNDTAGVQSAASALQGVLQSSSTAASSTTQAATSGAGSSGTGTQDGFLNDLQALISATQSGDTAGAQTAAQSLAQDIKSALDGGGAHVGGHHHHGGAGGATSAASSAQDPDGDGDAGGTSTAASATRSTGTTVGQAAGSDADGQDGTLEARQAYDLLMRFSQADTTAAGRTSTGG
ncbi:hypothetical protein [Azorhizobium doebereinerae]|uniref:hypothetical protein n=1 Tax=Azorhizobium doebereinerae TaxID=281091 RepID=UPI0012EC4D17|nr:hypothetical protein [Azorhizobium doebereinerae]